MPPDAGHAARQTLHSAHGGAAAAAGQRADQAFGEHVELRGRARGPRQPLHALR